MLWNSPFVKSGPLWQSTQLRLADEQLAGLPARAPRARCAASLIARERRRHVPVEARRRGAQSGLSKAAIALPTFANARLTACRSRGSAGSTRAARRRRRAARPARHAASGGQRAEDRLVLAAVLAADDTNDLGARQTVLRSRSRAARAPATRGCPCGRPRTATVCRAAPTTGHRPPRRRPERLARAVGRPGSRVRAGGSDAHETSPLALRRALEEQRPAERAAASRSVGEAVRGVARARPGATASDERTQDLELGPRPRPAAARPEARASTATTTAPAPTAPPASSRAHLSRRSTKSTRATSWPASGLDREAPRTTRRPSGT